MQEKKPTPAPVTISTIGAAPVAPIDVPWNKNALNGRECSTCACYFEQANPEDPRQVQGFCRRLPAEMAKVRMMEVRRDLQGAVVMRNGEPVRQPTEVMGYLFKPTRSNGTCFDGWRPLDTLPGERNIDASIRQLRHKLGPMLSDIPKEYRTFLAALFGLDTEETQN